MMTRLNISLLGGFEATLDDQPITLFGSDKARALLAYLALESDRPHRRSVLAALLWPESPAKKAAHNLSQTLLRLRRALQESEGSPTRQPVLIATDQEIRMNPLSGFRLDVADFRELIRAQQSHHHQRDGRCPVCIGWLEQAAQLYRGDFLTGLLLPDSLPFEEWQLIQQEALHSQMVVVLEQLVAYHRQSGEPRQMLIYARRLASLEPWQEEARVQLMNALVQCGQSAAALEQYVAFSRILDQEFQLSPSPKARALYEQIRAEHATRQGAVLPADPGIATAVAADGERRQVTAVICSRYNPTNPSDPEEQIEQLTRCREQCGAILAQYGGQRQPRQGTECLVYFGYPVAQENAAQSAVYAGLTMVSTAVSTDHLRIGIHTGMMIAREGVLVGDVPDLARACQHQAEPNNVWLTASTERLVHGSFTCQVAGQLALPGMAERLPVYRVVGHSASRSRPDWLHQIHRLSPFVGRDAEMAQLLTWLTDRTPGYGRVVTLSGEPGIGKSRLVWELRRRDSSGVWLQSHCTPYHQNTSLYPLIRILEELIGIQPDDTPQTGRDKLDQALVYLEMSQPVHIWALALLLELPTDTAPPQIVTEGMRQQMRQTFVALLSRYAASRRVVVLIEDLHWTDPSTLAWLDASLEALAAAGCLLLLTYRPTFVLPWRPRPQLRPLTLGPLSPASVAEMVTNLAGETAVSPAARHRVVALTDGNPLFVEELTWTFLETDALEADAPTQSDLIPVTLRDSLLARLDRVGAAKETAGWAAALGREFAYAVLTAVVPYDETRLQTDLSTLIAADLISPLDAPAQSTYTFRHALIQETAYASLLRRTRQAHHRRIAETYATRFPQISAAQPELLGEHYSQAQMPAQAADCWLQAGERAAAQGAVQEARTFFDRALAAITPDDAARRWRTLTGREAIFFLTGDRAAGQADIAALLTLAEAHANPQWRAEALLRRLKLLNAISDFTTMLDLADDVIHIAEAAREPGLAARALCLKAAALTHLGDPAAQEIAEAAVAYSRAAGDGWATAYATGTLALHQGYIGDYACAAHAWEEVLPLVRRSGDRALESRALSNLGTAYQYLGLYDAARRYLQDGIALGELIGDRQGRAYNLLNLGGVMRQQGEVTAAQDLLAQLLTEAAAMDDVSLQAGTQWGLGHLAMMAGDYLAAARYLADAYQAYRGLDMTVAAVEALALLAQCTLGIGRGEAAGAYALQVWRYLATYGAAAMDDAALVYLALIEVFAAVGETAVTDGPTLSAVVQAGYEFIMARADRISDPLWRQSFLENVPANRAGIQWWRRLHPSSPTKT